MALFLASVLIFLSNTSCVQRFFPWNTTPEKPALPYINHTDPFSLAPGEEVNADGFTLRYLKLVEDSRCPDSDTCVWEGRLAADFEAQDLKQVATQSQRFQLVLPGKLPNGAPLPASASYVVWGSKVTLVGTPSVEKTTNTAPSNGAESKPLSAQNPVAKSGTIQLTITKEKDY